LKQPEPRKLRRDLAHNEGYKLQKPLVIDATPIIYLCKIGLSRIFGDLPEEKYTIPKVVEEVIDKGKILGAPDALVAEELIQRAIIRVREPARAGFLALLSTLPNLHEAEAQVLALAKELEGIAIVDESWAREVSRLYNIEAHGTAYLLLRLMYRGRLSTNQVRDAIDDMMSAGWRLTAEEYAKLARELEAFQGE
jgi:predicted nucleic acid-binding protein